MTRTRKIITTQIEEQEKKVSKTGYHTIEEKQNKEPNEEGKGSVVIVNPGSIKYNGNVKRGQVRETTSVEEETQVRRCCFITFEKSNRKGLSDG